MAAYPNIAANLISTQRLTVCVREVASRLDGRPVVFIHGNVSSSPFFFPVMAQLPAHVRPIAVDLRGFGGTDTLPVDATRGLRDFADDVWSTLDALGLSDADLVGWSMGGGVVLQMLLDQPRRVTSVTLINPVSPYGFGGTTGPDGQVNSPDGAGTGAGTANPEFVQALQDGDSADRSPASPRNVMRSFYFAPQWDRENEDLYVTSMLSTSIGPDNYPGDSVPSAAWPGMAPGPRGVLNTMSPTNLNLSGIVDVDPKPPILWIRGDLDAIVNDRSIFDMATLGSLGVVPGYPGLDVLPPQPALAQTRYVLDGYTRSGGSATETVIVGAGHSPHLEKPAEFLTALRAHLQV